MFSPHPDADPFIKDFMSGSCKCQQLSVGRAWLRVEALPSKDLSLVFGEGEFWYHSQAQIQPCAARPPSAPRPAALLFHVGIPSGLLS